LSRAHLIVEIECHPDQPGAFRLDQHRAHTAEEDSAGERGLLLLLHPVADEGEDLLAGRVAWREVVGPVEIDRVDLVEGHEALDRQRLVALGHDGSDLLGFEHDELARADLVALDLILSLDRLAGFAVDILPLHAIAGRPVDGVEGDPVVGGCGGIESHRAGELGDLQIAFPVCSRCHSNLRKQRR